MKRTCILLAIAFGGCQTPNDVELFLNQNWKQIRFTGDKEGPRRTEIINQRSGEKDILIIAKMQEIADTTFLDSSHWHAKSVGHDRIDLEPTGPDMTGVSFWIVAINDSIAVLRWSFPEHYSVYRAYRK